MRKHFATLVCIVALGLGAAVSGEARDAKHIILIIGDGMHLEHEIAASRYLYGEDQGLSFHAFPYKNFMTTWDLSVYEKHGFKYDPQNFSAAHGYDPKRGGVAPYPLTPESELDREYLTAASTDSASAATAMATGVKTHKGKISPGLRTIAEMFRAQKGAAIGVVTTVPFDHATPAAFISHNEHRNHYYTGYDGYWGLGIGDEIAHSTRPDVMIGGGHPLENNPKFRPDKGYISRVLYSQLLNSGDYVVAEKAEGADGALTLRTKTQEAVDHGKKLFGLFGDFEGKFAVRYPAHDGMPRLLRTDRSDPDLTEAVSAALDVLARNPNGFFLLIEQGDIDWANHKNDFRWMIAAVIDLDEAVRKVEEFIDRPGDDIDWDNTLVIVTSDHANSYMRLNKVLGQGRLPRQKRLGLFGPKTPFIYPDGEVQYSSMEHTNELVSIYAKGSGAELFTGHEGVLYPGTRLIDNTHIFEVMKKTAGLQ